MATKVQSAAVAQMVEHMLPNEDAPTGSYTLGWDAVLTYSEDALNKMLSKHHAKDKSKMAKPLEFEFQYRDGPRDPPVSIRYSILLGPPVVSFHRAGNAPSLTMIILGGTEQRGNAGKTDLPAGWSLNIAGNSEPFILQRYASRPGNDWSAKGIFLDYCEKSSEQNPLLFVADRNKSTEFLKVEINGPPGADDRKPAYIAQMKEFTVAFIALCRDPTKEHIAVSISGSGLPLSGSAATASSLSLSPDTELVRFVYWTNAGYPYLEKTDRVAWSFFVKTINGSKSKMKTDGLPQCWTTLWKRAGSQPIPEGFDTSLILSTALMHESIFKQGFGASAFTTVDTSKRWNVVQLKRPSSEKVILPERLDGPSPISLIRTGPAFLTNSPMEVSFTQNVSGEAPKVMVLWKMEILLLIDIKVAGIPFGQQEMTLRYSMSDPHDTNKPLLTGSKVDVGDSSMNFSWALPKVKTEVFHYGSDAQFVRQDEAVKKVTPVFDIDNFGVDLTAILNLLTPGTKFVKLNETIGVRAPKDFVVVGHIEGIS